MNTRPTFLTDLITRALKPEELRWVRGHTQLYVVHERPLVYISPKYGTIEVPVGTQTDFASIPAAVHWLIDSDDRRISLPSVVHDYLYAIEGRLPDGRALTREQADDVLREAMLVCGASTLVAGLVYRSVRLGGRGSWGV